MSNCVKVVYIKCSPYTLCCSLQPALRWSALKAGMNEWAVRGHVLSTADGPVSSRLWPIVGASPGAHLPHSLPPPFPRVPGWAPLGQRPGDHGVAGRPDCGLVRPAAWFRAWGAQQRWDDPLALCVLARLEVSSGWGPARWTGDQACIFPPPHFLPQPPASPVPTLVPPTEGPSVPDTAASRSDRLSSCPEGAGHLLPSTRLAGPCCPGLLC